MLECEACGERRARYIDATDTRLCSLCDMDSPATSIRFTDVPKLLLLLEGYLRPRNSVEVSHAYLTKIKELLWKKR